MDNNIRQAIYDWALDCEWQDIETEEDLDMLTDEQLTRGIDKNYNGGMTQFTIDSL